MTMTQFTASRLGQSPARTRILIVEDEQIVALDIKDKIEYLGYSVLDLATTGEAAIRKVEELQPDLVFMDIRLSGDLDGVMAARRIRERFDVPIVYLTAYGDAETIDRVKATDPYGYVLKPFNERDLAVAVEVALYRHAKEKALKAAQDELEARAKRAATIADLGLAALRGTDFSELAENAVFAVTSMLQVECALLLEDCPAENVSGLQVVASSPRSVVEGTTLSEGAVELYGALRTVRVRDLATEHEQRLERALGGRHVRCGLIVTVEGHVDPWGVLVAFSGEPHAFTDEDRHFLQSIANVLSTAIKATQAQDLILEVSTPVLPVDEGLLLVPMIGTVDARRMGHFANVLLRSIRSSRARVVVLDFTGMRSIDEAVAGELLHAVEAANLLGTRTVLSGVSPSLADEFVRLATALGRIQAYGDLRSAIGEAERQLTTARR